MKTSITWVALLAALLSFLPSVARAGDPCVVTPSTVRRGNVEVLDVTGSDFSDVTAVSFGDTRLLVLDFEPDPTTLEITLQVGQRALAGTRDLTVTFSGAGPLVCNAAITVMPGQPALFQLNPSQVAREDVQTIVVTGQNLDAVLSLSVGNDIVANNYAANPTDPTRATVDLTVGAAAEARSYNVTATTGGLPAVLTNGLTVVPGALAADSVAPATLTRGQTTTVTVTGANLDIVESLSFGSGVSVGALALVSPAELAVTVSAQAESLPVGVTRAVTLTGGGGLVTLDDAFTVEAGTPTLTRIQPNRVAQGAAIELRLDGTNLDGLATFVAGDDLVASDFDPLSPTRVLVTVTLDEEAATGSRDVTVEGTFGEAVLVSGLTVLESIIPNPRVNFPNVVDAGQVEIGARKRLSLIFINEVDVDETVEIEILSGDIDQFAVVDASGETLDAFYPERLELALGALEEELIGIEYRPSLLSVSLAELVVVVRGEEVGRVDLRGTGIASTLSFSPTPPILLPVLPEGEVATRQVSTLATSASPPEILEVQVLVERNNGPFPEGSDLTTIDLSDPLPPQTRRLFGTTLMTFEASYPAGSYEGEVWIRTSQNSAPIMALSFTGNFTPAQPADESEGDEPGDVGPDADAGPDAGDQGQPDGAEGGEDADVAEPDADAGGGSDTGCCAQAGRHRDPSETWLLGLGLALLVTLRRRSTRLR